MSAETLEAGYWRAYRDFYSWSNILESTAQQADLFSAARHFAYKTAWKKLEPLWDWVIQLKHVSSFTGLLETVLRGKKAHLPVPDLPLASPAASPDTLS